MKYFLITLVFGWGTLIAQDIPALTPNFPSDEINPINVSFAPCTQTTNGTFEQSFGSNFSNFVIADDYYVAAGETSTIQTVVINVLTPQGNDIASADIKIHIDVSGFPGAVLEFFDDIVPSDQIVIQPWTNGNDFHQVTFDLSSSSLELEGGAAGSKYWISLKTTATSGTDNEYWESTTAITNGQAVYSVDGGALWALLVYEGEAYEMVMTVEGDCILSHGGDFSDANLKVFPNPTTGQVYFQGVPLSDFEVQIRDATGRILTQRRTEQYSLNISDLPSGLYFLSFHVDGASYSRKIIKGKITKSRLF
jgi:hypothetical protein